MTDGTGMIECKRLTFAKPIETISGWGGSRSRLAVDDTVCKIELDMTARVWRCIPHRGGEPLEGPFENLTGWKRKTAEVAKAPDPIDGEKEPEKPWTRKPPNAKMRKPRQSVAAAALEPASPTATP